MNRLTVCMIVRDEEEHLRECLGSLQHIWDELIVVDTGSVDNTIPIAYDFGANVQHFEWCDDFAAARNYAETFATGDYILWIDGDETLTEGHEIIRKIVGDDIIDAIRPSYRWPGHQMHLRQEMLRRSKNGKWIGRVHEYIDCPEGLAEPRIIYEQHARTANREWEEPTRLNEIAGMIDAEGLSFRTLSYLAREYAVAKRWAEVIAVGEMALAYPGRSFERCQLSILQGMGYRYLGDAPRARAAFLHAVVEDDTVIEGFYHVGLNYALNGQYAEAIPWLTAATIIEPRAGDMPFGEDIPWRRYAVLGQCYVNIGRLREGQKLLEFALLSGADDEVKEQMREVAQKMAVPA